MNTPEHESYCEVWDWSHHNQKTLNNAKPCTCGLRTRLANERWAAGVGQRPLRPLGMSEEDWLRTMGIKP